MRVNWVHVRRFRCFADSTRCYLDPQITVLAGKNESGKSNLLLALKKFSDGDFDELDYAEYVANPQSEAPTVQVCYLVSKKELATLGLETAEGETIEDAELELVVTRSMNEPYDLSGPAYEYLVSEFAVARSHVTQTIGTELVRSKDLYGLELTLPDPNAPAAEFLLEVRNCVALLTQQAAEADEKASIAEFCKSIEAKTRYLEAIDRKQATLCERLASVLPRFVLFDSFNDILPESIDESQVPGSTITKRFFSIVGLDPNTLFSEHAGQRLQKLEDMAYTKISGNFSAFWKQETITMRISKRESKLYFYIYDKDGNTPFKPQQRSKGLQWFLSFYLTLVAEEKGDIVFLVDEPGLYLHAKAQKDVLDVLTSKATQGTQIVLSTHSPYLMEPDHLERIRLVVKDADRQSVIVGKAWKGADRDTMTPIYTAIGHDLSCGVPFLGRSNLVVEGMSDYLYIQAMRRYLKDRCPLEDNVHVIPSVGANQILTVIALLEGWGLPYCVLLDNDSEGQQVHKRLRQYGLDEGRIIFVAEQPGHVMEDLFTAEDYAAYVTPASPGATREKNPKAGRPSDKVLSAREFGRRVSEGSAPLSEETVRRFARLLEKIHAGVIGVSDG